jgi:hypothetical protein
MTKETPYTRLLAAVRAYRSGVAYPDRKVMWHYPKGNLGSNWQLDGLYERVAAADLLGFDTKLKATDEGLTVEFVKRPADIEYGI